MKLLRPEEAASCPLIYDLPVEKMADVYRLAREAFTAGDLQKYTELEDDVSADEILGEMEKQQARFDDKEVDPNIYCKRKRSIPASSKQSEARLLRLRYDRLYFFFPSSFFGSSPGG